MPRTKLKKVAHKRNRNSTTEDIYGAFLTDLDRGKRIELYAVSLCTICIFGV